MKSSIKTLHSACVISWRLLAIAVGAIVAAVAPVHVLAAIRRANNEIIGHVPNMEPGVVVVLALFVVAPILAAVLLIELTRYFCFEQKPLFISSSVVLGVLAAWPVGYSLLTQRSYSFVFATSAFGVAAFYMTRWAWKARLARNPGWSRT